MGELLDVIIIGAGPAGLSSAKKLAENGFRVLVLEKEVKPNYEKLCAGYLPIAAFDRFNISTSIADYPVKGLKIVTRESEWTIELEDIVGYNLNRTKLAEYLANKVEKEGGEILTNTAVINVETRENTVIVHTGRDEASFKAKILVAADGAYSKIGSIVRGRFKSSELGLTTQVKAYSSKKLFMEISLKINIIFLGSDFSSFGYAWIFPKKGYVDAGLGALASRTKGLDLRKYLRKILSYYNLEEISKARYAPVPLTGPIDRIAMNRIILAGDSAGHVSPLTGEGIKFALLAGEMSAEAISAYLRKNIALHEVGKYYLSMLRKSFYRRFRLEKLILKFFKKGKMTSGKLLRDPKMREIIAKLYLDVEDTQRLVLASLPRLFKIFL
ncbi:MAG: hypothetical protein DRJ38_01540 [Thermoprotei archaeon]|nr:MAG: hypothetical protein DRJ38_01540 [Thermoprotei archaeon]